MFVFLFTLSICLCCFFIYGKTIDCRCVKGFPGLEKRVKVDR